MSDIIKILYNGVDAFAPQPTPFIGLSDDTIFVSERWAVKENMVLEGQLTGCSFQNIIDAQKTLVNNFNKSFQTLEIWQQEGSVSGKVYQKDLVEINDISFDQSALLGILPYKISLSCYPSGLFSGAFGILNPQDEWSYQEGGNAVLTATHSISCQPINTSSGPSNALSNARDWAFARTGVNSAVTPLFISGVSTNRFCLLGQNENIDRFNGTYSLTENYTNDLARTGYGIIRYTTTIESGSNIISVGLQGRAEGYNKNIENTRTAFNNLDKLSIAVNAYRSTFGKNDLNPIPLVQSFSEDPFTATIDFNYSYDNSDLPAVSFDYTVDLSVGVNGLITSSIQGTVSARGGGLANKLMRCKDYASSINLYNLVLPFYDNFDASSIVPLNSIPISKGQVNNESNGTVTLNAVFNNRLQVNSLFEKINYTIAIVEPITKYDTKPMLNGMGNYSVVNLNYQARGTCTVNGEATMTRETTASSAIASIKQLVLSLFLSNTPSSYPALESSDFTSDTNTQSLSFSFVWSYGP